MLSKVNGKERQSSFRAARQNRIFQDVVEQIQEAILRGDYQPGDMLPPERELKENFQTSRGTLREALRVLEQKGLIEIRLGVSGGARVKAAVMEPISESLGLMLRYRKISLAHLTEFREDVEGIVTAKAAERAGRADIENLEKILAEALKMVQAGVERWKDFLDADKSFHRSIARITGNPIYIFIHDMIHDNIQPYYDIFLPPDQKTLEQNYTDLHEILDSVKSRKVSVAREQARKHVHRFNEYMNAQNRTDA
ncbi:MAG: FadR/GntR family transcriptional regulator [Desulfococcaceae bacterium]|nr:FadR/GntR family transcriptional regulator [Desulfococcaceae bacterium]